jgi:hypothetical protein
VTVRIRKGESRDFLKLERLNKLSVTVTVTVTMTVTVTVTVTE